MLLNALDSLAAREANIEAQVLSIPGGREIVERKSGELGIYTEYSEIHQEYARLAQVGESEALKRALFLQWFEYAEPRFLTGIYQLDEKARDDVFQIIEQKCKSADLDTEMKWMIPYYYHIGPYFDEKKYPKLTLFSKANPPSKETPAPPKDAHLSNRGLMGRYWQSIKETLIRHKDKWEIDY